MKQIGKILIWLVLAASAQVLAQAPKEIFGGRVIGEGAKPQWLPQGEKLAFVSGDRLVVHDLGTAQADTLCGPMKIAAFRWINADSALVIEWPQNVTAKERVAKIVHYWIIDMRGKRTLLAADTSVTEAIPSPSRPFFILGGHWALRRSAGWPQSGFPETESYVVLDRSVTDPDSLLGRYRGVATNRQLGGTIQLRNLQREVIRSLALGTHYLDCELAPDYRHILAYHRDGAVVLDTAGKIVADLSVWIAPDRKPVFRKFFGAVWNNHGTGLAYFEVYSTPADANTLNYLDLSSGKRTQLAVVDYFKAEGFAFSPDDRRLAAAIPRETGSLIAVFQLP